MGKKFDRKVFHMLPASCLLQGNSDVTPSGDQRVQLVDSQDTPSDENVLKLSFAVGFGEVDALKKLLLLGKVSTLKWYSVFNSMRCLL